MLSGSSDAAHCEHLSVSLQNLLACFHSGSDSFSGDACEVKVAAPSHSPSAEAEYWRIKAMAQQVSLTSTLHENVSHNWTVKNFDDAPSQFPPPQLQSTDITVLLM